MIGSFILAKNKCYTAILRTYGRQIAGIKKATQVRLTYLIVTLCLFAAIGFAQDRNNVTVKRSMTLMGSRFDITVVAANEELGYINIQEAAAEIRRIEKLISSWDVESETSKINANAGIKPVKVSSELFKLIERCKQISEITDGAFDITFAAMDAVWKFDGTMTAMPTNAAIVKAKNNIGYGNILMNAENSTVFLRNKGMKISFGAIGKGYAVDKAKELLVSKLVVGGVINAAGDISTWGTKVSGEKWLIGIANPLSTNTIFTWVPLLESSVATAGNSEKFVTINGVKYADLVNPATGIPVNNLNSVSVFSKSAELADALATAIMVMGKDAGLALVNQLGGTEAILVDAQNRLFKTTGMILDDLPE